MQKFAYIFAMRYIFTIIINSKDNMKLHKYTTIFEPVEDGGYIATVPMLDGLTVEGNTLEEARENVIDAIREYIKSCQENGEEIPEEITSPKPIVEKISVSV